MLDLLLRDARVLTMADDRPTAHAVGVLHGRIVGVDEEIDGLPARAVVDCDGATLTPGFADAHNHMAWFGLSLAELDLTRLSAMSELYDAVAERAAGLPADAWVVGAGYDDFVLGGHPRRAELDRAGGGRPVWLKHRSAHMGVANSVVLDRAGVLDGTATVPPGGEIDTDADGAPTGLLKEGAQNLVKALLVPYPVDELAEAVARAAQVYTAEGLTHVTEAGIGGGWIGHSGIEAAAYQLARQRGDLPVRVELMTAAEVLHPVPSNPADGVPVGLDLGLRTGFGDNRLRLGPMKIFTDGALSSRTAAVTEPFCDHGGTGLLGDDPQVLRERIVAAHRAGWRVAAHAIGDRAIDVALDAFAEAQRVLPRPDVRHRIEHAAMVRPDQLPRFAELGVIPVPQARFLYEIGDSMADAVGEHRLPWLYRHRSFVDSGVVVPASSDRPCVAVGAPLAGMRSMVERTSRDGRVLSGDERVDAVEALRAYTTRSAHAGHAGGERGRVAAGLLADLVLLGDDPTTVPSARISDIEVLATFVGGECVHGAEVVASRCDGPVPARR
ncbi:amidohydrolase [Gandjariella thermophila]|uniref:Amidohydrolase n=1 Tax=Gandjariella thermophila TaxID=1931992 RepID=A0A4D4J2H5_9PSEU|nr:amidohydrolase [Gandjariella thermophila]GDY28988.1 amidohydrolase [Gandjariella thermophila]